MQKTKIIKVLMAASLFILVVVVLALYLQKPVDNPTLQEAIRQECEAVMNQMTQATDCDEKMDLYADNLKKCRAIYDTSSKEDYNFRLNGDGTFFDRIFTNALCYIQKNDKAKAQKVLAEARYEESDIISLGATGCEPGSFIEAFATSLDFPSNKCLKENEIKTYFLKALNDSNFQDLAQYAKAGKPLSMDTSGDLHFDCPSPFNEVQSLITDLSKNKVWKVSDEENEEFNRKIYFQTAGQDKLVLFIRKENDCEYLSDISALMNSSSR